MVGTQLKDFHLPPHSRSVFSRIGVVPAHQNSDCHLTYANQAVQIRVGLELADILKNGWNTVSRVLQGRILFTPTPPTPESTLLAVGSE